MTLLSRLSKGYGEPQSYERPSEELLKRYVGRVPDPIMREWQEQGWCCFANGVFWTVNPDPYAEVVREWLPSDESNGITVCARSGFGDLLMSAGEITLDLSVHYGRCKKFDTRLDQFLSLFLDREYVSKSLDGRLAMEAIKRLGPLAPDEMFTFEPALALGGAPEIKYVKKVKLFPQLSFLAQLFEQITIE